MKVCRYCGLERPDDAFDVCNVIAGRVYRRLQCRVCKRADKNARRKSIRQWLEDYKKELVCVRCGFADFRALEFHHTSRGQKDFNVADMLRNGASIQSIKREIDKCVVLCSNCHQIEHYRPRA